MEQDIKNERLNKVLQKAKEDTIKKDLLSFAFTRFFSTFLVLLAPFFTKNNTIRKTK